MDNQMNEWMNEKIDLLMHFMVDLRSIADLTSELGIYGCQLKLCTMSFSNIC